MIIKILISYIHKNIVDSQLLKEDLLIVSKEEFYYIKDIPFESSSFHIENYKEFYVELDRL
jgi:hypothetical protein